MEAIPIHEPTLENTSILEHLRSSNTVESNRISNSEYQKLRIAIAGGGLAGIASAIALARSGHSVTVYEASAFLGEIGAGIQIPPNAGKYLVEWGVNDYLKGKVVYPESLRVYRWQEGSLIGDMNIGDLTHRFRGPYMQVKRSDLHEALRKTAARNGVHFRVASRVVDYDFDLPSLTLEHGEIVKSDFIIAADGIRSLGRKKITGTTEPTLIPTGYAAFRATVDVASMREKSELAWLVEKPVQHAWIGPDRHVVTYTMLEDLQFNMVLMCPDPTDDASRTREASIEKIKKEFEGWDPVLQKLIDLIKAPTRWPIRMAPPLSNTGWSAPSGKFVLIGDAAHALPPNLAMGTAMAIEDGVLLARILGSISKLEELQPAMRIFETVRIGRTSAMQKVSVLNQQLWHLHDGEKQRARDQSAGSKESIFVYENPIGQEWLYGFAAEIV